MMFSMKLGRGSALRAAFTLVELMIVVVIVAILATVSVPIYKASIKDAQMSEGIAGCGTIRMAAKMQIAKTGSIADATLETLGFDTSENGDLDGKYFKASNDDYTFTPNANGTSFTVSVTHPNDEDMTYTIDQDGNETGTYKTQ